MKIIVNTPLKTGKSTHSAIWTQGTECMIKGCNDCVGFCISPVDIINGYIPYAWMNGLISKGVTMFEMPPLTTAA